MEELITTKQIIKKLGGVSVVAHMTGRSDGAAWNWTSFDRFPANTFVVIQGALAKENCTAPASLWGMVATDADVK